MPNRDRKKVRRINPVTAACCVIGGGVWWFFTSNHSTVAWILAALFSTYLCLGFLYLAITLPAPESHEPQHYQPHEEHHLDEDPHRVINNVWQL